MYTLRYTFSDISIRSPVLIASHLAELSYLLLTNIQVRPEMQQTALCSSSQSPFQITPSIGQSHVGILMKFWSCWHSNQKGDHWGFISSLYLNWKVKKRASNEGKKVDASFFLLLSYEISCWKVANCIQKIQLKPRSNMPSRYSYMLIHQQYSTIKTDWSNLFLYKQLFVFFSYVNIHSYPVSKHEIQLN